MQVNSINSISGGTNSVNDPESVSLNQRLADAQQVAAMSEPTNGDQTTTFDSIMEWIKAGHDQFLTDPGFMSEQINAMVKKMVDADGNKVVKGFSDVLEQMIAIKDAVDEAGLTDLEKFFHGEVSKLMGINFFMQDFLNVAMYPTVQNGGKIEAYEY